jgi:hypothetical protein
MTMAYAIRMFVKLMNPQTNQVLPEEQEVFWKKADKTVLFADVFSAKLVLGQLQSQFPYLVTSTRMEIVEIDDQQTFVTFPDPVTIPLIDDQKTMPDGRVECTAAEFYVSVRANSDLIVLMKELTKQKHTKWSGFEKRHHTK